MSQSLLLYNRIIHILGFCLDSEKSDYMISQTGRDFNDIKEISQLFKLLGNPKRLQLLYLLIQDSMSVTELSQRMHWEQSGVSHQLQLLRKFNLVEQKREGKTIIYHLEDPHVMTLIADVLSHAEQIIHR